MMKNSQLNEAGLKKKMTKNEPQDQDDHFEMVYCNFRWRHSNDN